MKMNYYILYLSVFEGHHFGELSVANDRVVFVDGLDRLFAEKVDAITHGVRKELP